MSILRIAPCRVFLATLVAIGFGLTKALAAEEPTATPSPTAESSNSSSQNENAPQPETSLVSLFAGAYVVKRPKEWMDDESAFHMLDEKPRTKWASPRGDISPETIVIALPDKTLLKTLEFDNSHIDTQFTGCSAKDITVEMSDTGEDAGFKKIAEVSLKDQQDHQRFPVSTEVPGRWVRLTVKNNHNPADHDNTIELSEFRAFGTQFTHTPLPDLSGTYEAYFTDKLHLKQEGTSVTGCYESRQGRIDGGTEGRALKFTYYEESGGAVIEKGIGVAVFSPDGKQMFSLWDESGGRERLVLGTKKTDEVGMCPEWLKLMKEIAAAEVPSPEPTATPDIATTPAVSPEVKVEESPTPQSQSETPSPNVTQSPTPTATSTPAPTMTPPMGEKRKSMTLVQAQLTSELAEFGRVRVYGINFDSDSDHIKDESKPTLDSIVAMLKKRADWKMSIEGHTDSTSTPQHNQGLSERRAASVKNYLTAADIDPSRLTTVGYGQDKPIAANDNPIGKAQNRRVELVKQ